MQQPQVEVASEVEEELVLDALLLQGAFFLEVQAHEWPDHSDPRPLPSSYTVAACCLATQAHDQPGLVTAGFGELV